MERDELARVFYGEGAVPAAWATDCPVRFDVWLAYARPAELGLDGRVDLILDTNEEYGTPRVLDDLLSTQLAIAECQPIATGSFISIRMTLQEFVHAILPMTNLASLVRLAQDEGPPGIEQAFDGTFEAPPRSFETAESEERQKERSRHFVWLVRLLQSVVSGAEEGTAAVDPRARVTEMLLRSQAKRTPSPRSFENPKAQVIDRRRRHPVLSVTTNRKANPAVTRSRTTVKADAAEQLFSVDCSSIGWAVVDSGIDARHPAFSEWWEEPGPAAPRQGPSRIVRAFNFVAQRNTLFADVLENGLIDWSRALPYLEIELPDAAPPPNPTQRPHRSYDQVRPQDPHGTHVAGIIGGWWPDNEFRGICPNIRLYDFRVLDDEGKGDEFAIVTALQAIRYINEQAGRMVIAGANVSLSVPHDVATHSCGWTPVCIECDRLSRSGVIVVAAAGNSGYSGVMRTTGFGYQSSSISDPGNTDSIITVGSTHRSNPHRHGVSYFSSRGPTADGRAKPDLLAPGEDIDGPVPGLGIAAMHGTSQAAAHVSGAAAMLVARYRELLGRPERVKSILCSTATDLGRERDFQGNGLVDVLRAMQSI